MLKHILADVGVKQVILCKRRIDSQSGRTEITPGTFGAAVVQPQAEPHRAPFVPVDLQVTGSVLGTGYDFNIGIGAGHPPEILQPLFDIAQAENIAA